MGVKSFGGESGEGPGAFSGAESQRFSMSGGLYCLFGQDSIGYSGASPWQHYVWAIAKLT